jgi:hypothetical protein
MMKRAMLLGAMLVCGLAYAGTQTGEVIDVRVSSKTLANPTHIKLSGAWQNRPACAVQDYWAIDSDTPAGKSFLAAVLAAQASNRPITIWGTDQCTLRTDMETVLQIGLAQ